MIRYGVAVDTPNQISLLPADTVADNIAAIALSRRGFEPGARTFHVTADRYYSLTELTCQVTQDFGYRFDYHDIPHFIAELNRLARRSDPVFPLLDFFNRSAPHIAAMSLKRYCNARYRQARDRCAAARPDPTLAETAARLVLYLLDEGWIDSPPIAAAPVAPPHIARVVA